MRVLILIECLLSEGPALKKLKPPIFGKTLYDIKLQNILKKLDDDKFMGKALAKLFETINKKVFTVEALEIMAKQPQFKKRLFDYIKSLEPSKRENVVDNALTKDHPLYIIFSTPAGSGDLGLSDIEYEFKTKKCRADLQIKREAIQDRLRALDDKKWMEFKAVDDLFEDINKGAFEEGAWRIMGKHPKFKENLFTYIESLNPIVMKEVISNALTEGHPLYEIYKTHRKKSYRLPNFLYVKDPDPSHGMMLKLKKKLTELEQTVDNEIEQKKMPARFIDKRSLPSHSVIPLGEEKTISSLPVTSDKSEYSSVYPRIEQGAGSFFSTPLGLASAPPGSQEDLTAGTTSRLRIFKPNVDEVSESVPRHSARKHKNF